MVVTHPLTGEQLSVGIELVTVPNLRETLQAFQAAEFDFIVIPLAHPRYERVFESAESIRAKKALIQQQLQQGAAPTPKVKAGEVFISRSEPFTRSDLELSSGEWMGSVIGKISPWIHLDSINERMRSNSEKAMFQELSYASHLSLRAVLLNAPLGGASTGVANFGRCVNAALLRFPNLQIWIRLPVKMPDALVSLGLRSTDTWEVWNAVRTMCDSHPNLCVALELNADVPSAAILERWIAEPFRLVLVSTSAFQTNRHGYPVLSKPHQQFLRSLFQYRPHLALCHRLPPSFETSAAGKKYRLHVEYLAHFFGKQPVPTEAQRFEIPYHDYLMAPLQPLKDHLESKTYETFEKDTVKYEKYSEAVAKCLTDKKRLLGNAKITVMVLGAGRGPLVRSCLAAAVESGADIEVFAVEKNPNAVLALESRVRENGWDNVTIVREDIRSWEPTRKADVIVSELLGSFGDNELSPECLDSAERFLKPNGVSIPSSCTSFIAPLASEKLHNEVKTLGESMSGYETPYVVSVHRGMVISPSKDCFTFFHPKKSASGPLATGGGIGEDNSRHRTIGFVVPEANVLHGFVGYFEATLYKDVKISTRPETRTPDMFSWFPLYIPIRNPMNITKEGECRLEIWRRVEPSRVWYEWAVSTPEPSGIHNPNGRSYSMALD